MKCEMCKTNEATCYGTPDFATSDEIHVCESCGDILLRHQRNVWHHRKDESFYSQNRVLIDKAYDALNAIYEARGKAKKKK